MNTAAPTIMDALPDDILLIFIHLLRDSRGFGLTHMRVYRLYTGTPDYKVFTRRYLENVAKNAPAKLCMLFTPAELYYAGNLPCLKEWWRRGIRVKSHFIGSVFGEDCETPVPPPRYTTYLPNGAEMAEWLWATFRSEFIRDGYDLHTDAILVAHHIELLQKIVGAVECIDFDAPNLKDIHELPLFRLAYDNWGAESRCDPEITFDTPTCIVTYLSMRGEKLVAAGMNFYARNLEYIRALRLDDVLENYAALKWYATGEVSDWLNSLVSRVSLT